MSNQIQATGAVKIRTLTGVLTGSAGVVSSVPLGAANGVATLDNLGKVPLSQLPASVVTYLGTWNAATNTPTLANGVGDVGDLYICNVAGTVNFGAGPITFAVGDWVIYSGTTWQKSSGASGTVTSVAVTETSDALSITGSPITTSGTINIGFAGTTGQYVNGAGGLTTFPTLTGYVPYVGATANLDLGTYGLISDFVQFNLSSSAIPTTEGTMSWNNTDGTADLIMKGGNVTLQIGQEQLLRVVNKTGVDLLEASYSSVYLSGAQGQRPKVNLALANNSVNSSATLGLVTENIPNNLEGFITTSGMVREINTTGSLQGETWSEGQALYLSATTAGAVTNIPPVEPNHRIVMGYVIYAHAVHGSIFVKVSVGLNLDDLNDVEVTAPSNNDGLFFNSSTNIWQHKSIATALGYTPANDSLVVHLAGAETITGIKTFSVTPKFDADINLLQDNNATFISGYTSIYSDAGGVTMALDATKRAYFNLVGLTGPHNYTLQNASGTLAFTSDIPSLSGYIQGSGTIGYVPKFTASGTIGDSLIYSNTTGIGIGTITPAAGIILDVVGNARVSGTLFATATTSGVGLWVNGLANQYSAYILGSATTSQSYGLSIQAGTNASDAPLLISTYSASVLLKMQGDGKLLIGTTTAGSGKLMVSSTTADNHIQINGTSPSLRFTNAPTGATINGFVSMVSVAGDYISGSAVGDMCLGNQNSGKILFGFGAGTAAQLMAITSTGVGIGNTASSGYKLDVTGTGRFSSQLAVTASTTNSSFITGGLEIQSYATNNAWYGNNIYFDGTNFRYRAAGYAGQLYFNSDGSFSLNLSSSSTAGAVATTPARLVVTNAGNVGIGNTGPSNTRLTVTGVDSTSSNYSFVANNSTDNTFLIRNDKAIFAPGIYSFSTGSVANVVVFSDGSMQRSTVSSARFKKNITNWEASGLNTILALQPKEFTYKEAYYRYPNRKFLGLIAEEVKEVSNYLVDFENEDGSGQVENVRYANIVVPIIKAIQEQQTIITDLNERLSKLENK